MQDINGYDITDIMGWDTMIISESDWCVDKVQKVWFAPEFEWD